MSEPKSSRFRRLAIYRTNQVLEKVRILGNLANKSNYEYTDNEVKKIFSTIEEEIRHVKEKFKLIHQKRFSL